MIAQSGPWRKPETISVAENLRFTGVTKSRRMKDLVS